MSHRTPDARAGVSPNLDVASRTAAALVFSAAAWFLSMAMVAGFVAWRPREAA